MSSLHKGWNSPKTDGQYKACASLMSHVKLNVWDLSGISSFLLALCIGVNFTQFNHEMVVFIVGKYSLLETWVWGLKSFLISYQCERKSFNSNIDLLTYLIIERRSYSAHHHSISEGISHPTSIFISILHHFWFIAREVALKLFSAALAERID